MSWTQSVCEGCWASRNPGRQPLRLLVPVAETCCYCNASTSSGIYARIDPATVPYPQEGD